MKIVGLVFLLFVGLGSFVYCQISDVITPLMQPAKTQYRAKKDPQNISGSFLEPIEMNVAINFPVIRGSIGATEIVSQTTYENLAFEEQMDVLTGQLQYFLRITSERDRKVLGSIEDTLSVPMNKADKEKLRKQPIVIRKLINLPPGNYIADVVIRDKVTGNRGLRVCRFTVSPSKRSSWTGTCRFDPPSVRMSL